MPATQIATFAYIKLEPHVNPRGARTIAVQLGPSQTLARGTIMGQKTSDSKFYPYASGNSDGTQVPVGPLVYDCVTDANSNVVVGPTGTVQGLLNPADITAEVYYRGAFLETLLTGLDANAVTVLKARELGTGATKYILIP